jgi:hypothetical protein
VSLLLLETNSVQVDDNIPVGVCISVDIGIDIDEDIFIICFEVLAVAVDVIDIAAAAGVVFL